MFKTAAGREDLYVSVPVYPADQRGRYALGRPDGIVLFPGMNVEVFFSGIRLMGTVQRSERGDYLQFPNGQRCGLCPGMRVLPGTPGGTPREQKKQQCQEAQVKGGL